MNNFEKIKAITLEKIQETLAWAINRIWQDLSEEEKQQVKEFWNE